MRNSLNKVSAGMSPVDGEGGISAKRDNSRGSLQGRRCREREREDGAPINRNEMTHFSHGSKWRYCPLLKGHILTTS